MALSPELWFAYRFPFSPAARSIVRKTTVDWNKLEPELVREAYRQIGEALEPPKREPVNMPPTDAAVTFLQAFALAKVLLSFAGDNVWYEKFSRRIGARALGFLQADEKPEALVLQVLDDLGVGYERDDQNRFVLSATTYLSVALNDPNTRLVHQDVSSGKLGLSLNGIQRWLAQYGHARTFQSLPVDTSGLPTALHKLARDIKSRMNDRQRASAIARMPAGGGPLRPDFFPPCMADLFTRLSAGENLPHMARFDLAAFLFAAGNSLDATLSLFARAPNYSEKITRYQLERIEKLKLSAPNCAKIREHGFCPLSNCTIRNPVAYYRGQLRKAAAEKKGPMFVEESGA